MGEGKNLKKKIEKKKIGNVGPGGSTSRVIPLVRTHVYTHTHTYKKTSDIGAQRVHTVLIACARNYKCHSILYIRLRHRSDVLPRLGGVV